MTIPPRSVLITGASSGLGEAMAMAYAADGCRLFLFGRDEVRLEAVAAKCRAAGGKADYTLADVTDETAMAAAIGKIADDIDLVVANAGISGGTGALGGEGGDQTRRIFEVNLNGVINTVMPALERMRARGRGQIAIISSLAGFRGLPSAPAYCASKAAVRVWGEGLREWVRPHGISVSVVCPGFVRTPLTALNDFPMPFLMDADRAAAIVKAALAADKARIAFPWPMVLAVRLLAALPQAWTGPLVARTPRKA